MRCVRVRSLSTSNLLAIVIIRYVFPFTPLHPLVMHEDSVRLCVGEGEDSASPLTINVNMALALGTTTITASTWSVCAGSPFAGGVL